MARRARLIFHVVLSVLDNSRVDVYDNRREAKFIHIAADPGGSAILGVDLRLLACWYYGFEIGQGHGCRSC